MQSVVWSNKIKVEFGTSIFLITSVKCYKLQQSRNFLNLTWKLAFKLDALAWTQILAAFKKNR